MPMSAEHKKALAQGRRESNAIRAYLEALESRKPGRPATPDSVKERIASIENKLQGEDDPLKRVDLQQQKIDAEQQLEAVEKQASIDDLETGFVEHAKSYSERKGITYTAWRAVGVPASVLKKAGIPRTRRS